MPRSSSIGFLTVISLAFFLTAPAQDQTAAPAPAAEPFFFHDGDSPIVFLGDSITEQRMYTTLIETFILSRFPDWKVTFRNAGWGGDTSWLSQRGDLATALYRDVLSLHPAAVTIDFGMNDARGGDGTYTKYLESETALVKQLEKTGARVALITPSPEERYETDAPAGSHYNLVLQKYVDGLKLVADNEKVPLIDQFTPFIMTVEAGRKTGVLGSAEAAGDPAFLRLTNEGIHPNWGGHLIMASAILQGLHAPADVSSVEIDAASHGLTASEGCTVAIQDAPPGSVKILRTDRALPWPIPNDPAIDAALKIQAMDPINALDRFLLKVTGLKGDKYNLFIDDVPVGTWDIADLATGINLATVKQGPIYDQEQKLLAAVIAKNDAYFNRWRQVQLLVLPAWLAKTPGVEDARKAELTRLDGVIADAEKSIETLRQPVPHTFRLEPAK